MTNTATTFRPPPLPPPPGQRSSSFCERHPDQPVTGFCASCLRERLAKLDPALHRRSATGKHSSSSGKPTSFRPQSNNNHHSSASTSLLPELRRCKSFSFSSHCLPPPAAAFEPQRRSCDVRARSTLWSLFHQDDDGGGSRRLPDATSTSVRAPGEEIEADSRNLGFLPPVSTAPLDEKEEEEEEEEEEEIFHEAAEDNPDEIRRVSSDEIVVEEEGEKERVRPAKEHIDLDAQAKKPPSKDLKEIAGSFWLAASVFSKKLQKWRRKQKLKKQNAANVASNGGKIIGSSVIRREKTSSTQSEIAIDMFGRRSCDTDPRFSLDAGRMSFDDPRFSWDEPRASWDGYLIGGRSVFPRLPPMLSVVEDVPSTAATVQRSDGLIPVEEDPTTPGGSVQTRDYYSDASQRRRRSLDRSSSVRRPGIVVENDEPKPVSNAKVSPAVGNEFFHHVNKLEREFRHSNSLGDDHIEGFGATYGDNVRGGGHLPKKSNRWSKAWNIWGLIHRLSNGKGGGNGVDRSLSESWPELRKDASHGRMSRSNSSVSSRHSFSGSGGGVGHMRRNDVEVNGHTKKRRNAFVLERNRSARYSPGHLDNGLLRFYLTPMWSSRHGGSRMQSSSHSFTRSMMRLY